MVVDVGTNTEVVLTDGHRMVAASSPAGPAFEGGLVRYAMPASDGAIEHARLVDGRFECQTVGDAPPEGICGSGLIDILAELRRSGELRSLGAFRSGIGRFVIEPERGISLSRADISHLAQAKAANAVAQQILLRRLGLAPERIERLALAGGFASEIDVRNAIDIGFLVPLDPARVTRAGNAALIGARGLLLSRVRRAELDGLAERIEHVELEREPDFFELFADACRLDPIAWPEPSSA
jgi:uncharacterized 2Fe-2S/4Fe-4S cluster protein (DUF4445 family)